MRRARIFRGAHACWRSRALRIFRGREHHAAHNHFPRRIKIVSAEPPKPTGQRPVLLNITESRPAHVGATAGVDLDVFAFFNEERDVDCFSRLEHGRLSDVAGGVAAQAFR